VSRAYLRLVESSPALAASASWFRRRFVEPDRPLVAVEVRAGSVGVVRARREKAGLTLVAATSVDVPGDVLQLSMAQDNLMDPARFRTALRGALERAGILGGARIALVLPDVLARVTVLPASDVTTRKKSEVEDLLRFKLKKTLPFEVREARLAHVGTGSRSDDRIVVAAAFAPMLSAYEDACVSLGLQPGLVELAGLVLARTAFGDQAGDRLLVNWDSGYLSLLIVRDGWPILVRSLPGEVAETLAGVTREVNNTVLYHRDRLGAEGLIEAAVRCTVAAPGELHEALRPIVGAPLRTVDPWAFLGGASVPEVAQALAGAASCVGGRA
jgi:hypothetical protein